ncbi:zinc finger protein 454-like [Spodoptera frugiperda]|uniref:Zinc finger protein 454-like n=1 Tax=Spodoptera frugiperda TaxID=7108 RepID=A0A9R0DJZ7_SPOFR|nr:zinc finger protein 454-like [Spodoptera frugiperda]
MDDSPELELKKLCCTCLSRNRKLFQLCRLPDGINNLYSLLSYDSEAYREGFYRDTMSLYICWECRAVMSRITRFRLQACTALKHLSDIADGRTNVKSTCLSRLTSQKLNEIAVTSKCMNTDNFINLTEDFIDCGPTTDLLIKHEYDDDDIPLSELNNWSDHDPATVRDCKDELSIANENELSKSIDNKDELSKTIDHKDVLSNTIEHKDELSKCIDNKDELSKCIDNKDELSNNVLPGVKKKRKHVKKRFSLVSIDDSELEKMRSDCRMDAEYLAASFKCDSCIEIFDSETKMNEHNSLHLKKPNHSQCDVCLVYTSTSSYTRHRQEHYHRHDCKLCKYTSLNEKAISVHLETKHEIKEYSNKKTKTNKVTLKEDSTTTKLKDPSLEYKCDECDQYFGNKSARWKHVQKCHREGFECATCGQRFPFKNNLRRHEQRHKSPPPREECEICHKMIRISLKANHAKIHTERPRYRCEQCDKTFVSRESYENHLKYSMAHAKVDLLKYKCSMCEKGYRSRNELRDHVNYQHMGKTQHKCPICEKALATRRCITRHVKRAHEGIKENVRDKMCQTCGKAFTHKKSLIEHELIHSGARPLWCELCGSTFRQSASLYTHRKRVHRLHTARKTATLLHT